MTDGRISVLLLVQNRLLREGLERLLRKEADIRVVGTSVPHSTPFQQILNLSPEVLLVDSGVLITKDAQSLCSDLWQGNLEVIVIHMESDQVVFEGDSRAGLIGCIGGDASAAKIVELVQYPRCSIQRCSREAFD